MALLTVTESAKAVGISRTTIYEKIKDGELSRNAEKLIDTADLLRVFGAFAERTETPEQNVSEQTPQTPLAGELLDMVQSKDAELNALRSKLDDTERRLSEHREAARALMPPEVFKKRESQWHKAMQERQTEIENAKIEAAKLREREQQTKAENDALKNRGFIDRLLNRTPTIEPVKG